MRRTNVKSFFLDLEKTPDIKIIQCYIDKSLKTSDHKNIQKQLAAR